MIVPNELSHIVTFLHIRNGESYTPIGTAFFISIVDGEHFFTYIVTCKHVVENCVKTRHDIYMRLNRSDKIDVAYEKIEGEWIYHDSEVVDLAVARHIPRNRAREMYAYDTNIILTRKEQEVRKIDLPLGHEAVFIGLFAQYTGSKRNFPIARQGSIALITNEPVFTGQYGESDYHILECQAYPGNSGSPVWVPLRVIQGNKIGVEWRIWGVINGYFRLAQPVCSISHMDEDRPDSQFVYSHLGVSLVTPADHIIEILNQEVFVEQRKHRIDAGKMTNRPAPAGISVSEPTAPISRKESLNALDGFAQSSPEDEE